jgi:hypothetical protein
VVRAPTACEFRSKFFLQALKELSGVGSRRKVDELFSRVFCQAGAVVASPWTQAEECCRKISFRCQPLKGRIHPAIHGHISRPVMMANIDRANSVSRPRVVLIRTATGNYHQTAWE